MVVFDLVASIHVTMNRESRSEYHTVSLWRSNACTRGKVVAKENGKSQEAGNIVSSTVRNVDK